MAMRAQGKSSRCRTRRWVVTFVFVCLALVGLSVAQNNISVRSVTHAQFTFQLDQALERGTAWVAAHADGMLKRPNSVLFHMLADMDARKPDARSRRLTEQFMSLPGNGLWRRLVDPTASSNLSELQTLDQLQDYQRWFLFATAPNHVPLSDEDRRQMFAPNAHHWGSLTHQLFALYLFRRFQGTSQATDTLIAHLCERVAVEAFWDVRVTDLYLQRTAFLLAAGRPDLVRRRWVERVLASQQDDGGWIARWYAWGPGLLQFSWHTQTSNAHTTVQGVWLLHLLRFRYPEWMAQEFPGP